MTEPIDRFVSARVISRGVAVAPAFRKGLWGTLMLAFIGTGARLVIPILIQQTIDKALVLDRVDLSLAFIFVPSELAAFSSRQWRSVKQP